MIKTRFSKTELNGLSKRLSIEGDEERFVLRQDELIALFCAGYMFKDILPINEAAEEYLKTMEMECQT